MRSEVIIYTDNAKNKKEEVIDMLVISLARCGYSPYISDDDNVCFVADNAESIHELKETV